MSIAHIGVDSETHSFQAGNIAPRLVASTLSRYNPTTGQRTAEIYNRDDTHDVVAWLLDQPDPMVAAFAAFDFAVFQANWPKFTRRIFERYEAGDIKCILIREALHILAIGEMQDDRSRAALSLKETYYRRCGKVLSGKKEGPDSIRLNFAKLDGVPLKDWPAEAVEYAIQDAVAASEIFVCQEDLPDEDRQTRASFALYLMACTGFRTDPASVHHLKSTLMTRVARMNALLMPTGIIRPSGSRNIALIKAFVEKQYADLDRGTPYVVKKGKAKRDAEAKEAETGIHKDPNVSYSKDVLKELPCWTLPLLPQGADGAVRSSGGDGDECEVEKHSVCANPLHWLKARQEDEGELTKYVGHLELAAVSPVNYSVTSLISTGRTSISDPPLQQLPRRPGVRQCIVPPEGHWFIGADYGAIELTTLGQILLDMFGKSLLAETIQAGKDPHSLVASMLCGISYEEFVKDLKAKDEHGHPTEVAKHAKSMRQLAKSLDFGVPGGLGAETFVAFAKGTYNYRYKGTPAEQVEAARKHIRQFKSWFPEIAEYLKRVGQACDEGGGFFDLIQPRSGRIRGRGSYTQMSNSSFQGLASDLAKDAIWRITKEMYMPGSCLFGCRVVVFMHDELVSQAPIEIAAEAAERQAELMLEASRFWTPDVPTSAKPWISRRWEKDAEGVYDEDGRLTVWEPPE